MYTGVHDLEQVKSIENAKLKKPIHAWVQIDVGMHRLGSCNKDEIFEIKRRLEASPNVVKPVGLISHLSVADTPSEVEYNKQQIDFFNEIGVECNYKFNRNTMFSDADWFKKMVINGKVLFLTFIVEQVCLLKRPKI